MNDDSIFEYEGRNYVNPNTSRDEQLGFIDTLRQTNTDNLDRINQDTHALGSQVAPAYGGFSNGSAFKERYNTPQVNNIVAGLKATAQQTALNQALTNLQNQWSQRYNEAYRDAKVKEYNQSYNSSNGSNSSNSSSDEEKEDEDLEIITTKDEPTLYGLSNKYTVVSPDGILHIVDMATGDEETVNINKAK